MEYTTEYDKTNDICFVHVTGKHKRPGDSIILQKFVRDFSETTHCQRFLLEYIQAQIIAHTIDSYEAGTMPIDPDHKMTAIKIALLFTGDMTEHKFMENVAFNRGYQVRVFDNRDEAMAWLIPQKTPLVATVANSENSGREIPPGRQY